MAIAEVWKVQILVAANLKEEILSCLQQEGLVQLERADFENLALQTSLPDVSSLEVLLQRLAHALDYLSQWQEENFIKKLFSQKPQLKLSQRQEILKFDYKSLLERIEALEEEEADILSEIKFLEKEKQFLWPLKPLKTPVSQLKPTESSRILLGYIPLIKLEALTDRAEEEPLWYQVINKGKREVYVVLLYLKEEEDRLEQELKELSFAPISFTDEMLSRVSGEDRVIDLIKKIEIDIKIRTQRIESLQTEGKNLTQYSQKLMTIYDLLHNEKEKTSSLALLGETDQVSYLEGWIRSSDQEKLKSALKPFQDFIEIYWRPPLPGENPPVILENPPGATPFELVTKLYGLPQRGSLDPTLWLAPFFFIFVGLCVSEAGYGLVMVLLSFLFIKLAKPRGGLLQFLKLTFLLGISTVIMGTLVGGWFGFPLRQLMVLDPLKDPLSFLMLSLILGFIQVWFGTLLNMINGLKNKLYLQSIFVQGGWLVLLPCLVLYLMTKGGLWGILTIIGASGIVFFSSPSRNPLSRFFGGLYNLYDISRYLADILSYSRLLALGLATSVIAMVVNTLCKTALSIPWLGWLLAALIFVGGHLFNLGISFLGGFVHSMRLQFVEFFSKFFKSGGRPFKPFELESKYVEFI